MVVQADRGPGRPWTGPAPTRIGYASSTPARPGLREQLAALRAAGCEPVFREDASARVKDRPERDRALQVAASAGGPGGGPVVLTVHELGGLARDAAELMTLAAALAAGGVRLEVLTGPLAGTWDPRRHRLAAVRGSRRGRRARPQPPPGEDRRGPAGRGGPGAAKQQARVFDEEMTAAAVAMRERGLGVPEIAAALVVPGGRKHRPTSLARLGLPGSRGRGHRHGGHRSRRAPRKPR